jgi:ammonium transporter Rh
MLLDKKTPSMKTCFVFLFLFIFCFSILFSETSLAQEETSTDIHSVVEVQKYNRSIHIMAMLLAGFGFLMTFVRGYGKSALTATFLMVSISIPTYILINDLGIIGGSSVVIDRLILSEFAAAGLLIAAGAALGRLKMSQYLLLGLFFIPFYMINEWILLENGLNLIPVETFVDTGGSIVIHAFGALFGLGVVIAIMRHKDQDIPIQADYTSDRFSMIGSMILWIFWPSFCAALVPTNQIPQTIVNVILALCGSTLATYAASVSIRGKIQIADIANASLAGGVAIGSVCLFASPTAAFLVGIIAGLISTIGFSKIKEKLEKKLNMIDTCGVLNLHGLPGLFGGFSAIFIVAGINIQIQIIGIVITMIIGIGSGLLTGKILKLSGKKKKLYTDEEEFSE